MSRNTFGEADEQHWSNIKDALWHPLSLIFITVLVLALGIRSPWGWINLDVPEIAKSVFGVAGTMVALILPAAQIANSFVREFENAIRDKIVRPTDVSPQVKSRATSNLKNEVKAALYPAWRASVFVFISFLLSILVMIIPAGDITFGDGFSLSVDRSIASAAIGFLLAGSAWFLPTARYAFKLELLDRIEGLVQSLALADNKSKEPGAPESQNEAGTPPPVQPPQ